jgi:putative transposase
MLHFWNITYIRLRDEFVFLAVILVAHSRRVGGWVVDRTLSMSRKDNPWDNAACESFTKTLKYEKAHRNEYRDLAEARASIHELLDIDGGAIMDHVAPRERRLVAVQK